MTTHKKLTDTVAHFDHSLEQLLLGKFVPVKLETSNSPLDEICQKYNDVLKILEDKHIQQKLLEKNLQLARESAENASIEKSRFLANMSHEIRTPINGIIGITRILENTNLDATQKEHLSLILDSANFLHGVINDILDLSKIEAGKMEIEKTLFSMDELIDFVKNTILFSTRKKNIQLIVSNTLSSDRLLHGDPLRIRQILINLLSNAVKFTPRDGKIQLIIQPVTQSKMDATVLFKVIDSGIGINPESQSKLFVPFQQGDTTTTKKFGGTGLGLSICKKLTELMKGEIGFESAMGIGSTFWFKVPIDLGPATQELLTPSANTADDLVEKIRAAKIRVLMAEDHFINQVVAKGILKKYGLDVDVVENGIKAVEAAQSGKYHIIFMDCQMPDMDGYEATSHIRNLPNSDASKVYIIALTANAMKGDRELCIKTGMDGFIPKPIDPQTLEAELRNYFIVSQSQARTRHGA